MDKQVKAFSVAASHRFPTVVLPEDAPLTTFVSALRAGPCRVKQGDRLWWVRPIGEGVEVEVWPLHAEGPPVSGPPRTVAIRLDDYIVPPLRTVRRPRAEKVRTLAKEFRKKHFV